MGLHFGFHIEGINVKEGHLHLLTDLDSATSKPNERFVFLAAGIAGEEFFYRNYDPQAMSLDQQMISDRGGGSIKNYLPQALDILTANESRLRKLRERLIVRVTECAAEASFDSGSDSFNVLTASELAAIWGSRAEGQQREMT